jgi:hypothetical protein
MLFMIARLFHKPGHWKYALSYLSRLVETYITACQHANLKKNVLEQMAVLHAAISSLARTFLT